MVRLTRLRLLVAPVLAVVALGVAACAPQVPTATSPTTPSPTTPGPTTTGPTTTGPTTPDQAAARRAAGWLLAQFGPDGSMDSTTAPGAYDAGNAVTAIADLAALGVGDSSLATRVAVFQANMAAYIDQGAGDRAGALARVIMLAVAVGGDPHAFGGTDLVARLEATLQPSGLFGSQAANFDGSFRQGLALSALSIVTPRPASITPAPGHSIQDIAPVAWLRAQQCGDGSWMMYRSSTVGDCVENPAAFRTKDSNGTALAVLGLSAVGATADTDPTPWFAAMRGADGGWGSSPSGTSTESDADSTGLVIAALESTGDTPDASAYSFLRSLQLLPPAPVADQGAFTWKLSSPSANRLATLDATTALFDETWPGALRP